jgi:transposase
MARAYSYDLRLKVMNFVDKGKTIKEASRVFLISRKTIMEWKRIKKESGDFKAKTGYQTGHRRVIKDIEKFKEFVKQNYDKSGAEMARLWDQKVSPTTITRLLNKLGYTYKKKLSTSKKGYWSEK